MFPRHGMFKHCFRVLSFALEKQINKVMLIEWKFLKIYFMILWIQSTSAYQL